MIMSSSGNGIGQRGRRLARKKRAAPGPCKNAASVANIFDAYQAAAHEEIDGSQA